MKKIIYSIASIILIGSIIVIGLNFLPNNNAITVSSSTVTEKDLTEILTTTGTLIANKTSNLNGSGKVSTVSVKVGDTVDSQQTLASYDDGSNLVSEISGTVTQVNISNGDYDLNSQQGKYSIVVEDLSSLKVEVNLSKNESKKVKQDQTATITSNNEKIKGKVSEKDPTASNSTSETPTLHTIISLDETPKDWFAGFDVDVDINVNSEKDALVIPLNSLSYEDDSVSVFKIVDDKTKKVTIKTGIQSEKDIQVLSGLKKGDKIVVNPDYNLKNNTNVKSGK